MNRIDRLFAILLLLQRRGLVRAAELAAELAVSERTIYRDMLALSESGVPIVGMPGVGYELMEGYYLPPVRLQTDEATALILGMRMLLAQTAPPLAAAATRALDKISALLPAPTRSAAEAQTAAVAFYAPAEHVDFAEPASALIRLGIREQRVLRLRYYGQARASPTERDIEPHELTLAQGVWYVNGFCRLRQAERSFRLSRIQHLELREDVFVRREAAPTPAAPPGIPMQVRVAAASTRWVRERQHYSFVREEAGPAADVIMHYAVQDTDELVGWLLSWGVAVEPLAPPALRDAVRQAAQQVVTLLT